ncbi:ImmA/IrrE family metallo-endopeptidase [Lactobacillus taiwanensis]|uniref:ImmA/IrrE family metallo-endopeptidase n=1 Tax=Lactobacillus taiwanensis TaxID=508451 RepID=UPI0025A93EFB|nr:ImmA/IrrE family metallo-endopeptidase [Lactobacillus taiwanensis]
MVSATYPVKNSILKWVLSSNDGSLSEKWKNKIEDWLEGDKLPTIIQLQHLSKASHIDFGNFFLDEPPKNTVPLLNYRTINNSKVINPSQDLIDVINQMQFKSDWLADYNQNEGLEKIPFVGQGREKENRFLSAEDKAQKILSYFDLDLDWNLTTKDAFKLLRQKLELANITVMKASYVGRQTLRSLNTEEFRAFVLVNDYAPLIFINTCDSQNAKLFSLVHEMVHIWMGDSELFNNDFNEAPKYLKPTSEQKINKIVEQILFSRTTFLKLWKELPAKTSEIERIYLVAQKFHTSPLATAIVAKNYELITQDIVNKVKVETAHNTELKKKRQKAKSGGPSYYTNVLSNLDHNFARSVIRSTKMGNTSYTDAFDLLGVSGNKGFNEIKDRLEG